MFHFLICLMISAPIFANAAIQREINGVKYYLHDDFDTADGECALRGKEYASGFYSMTHKAFPVAKLAPNGKVRELIQKGTQSYPIIDGIDCE